MTRRQVEAARRRLLEMAREADRSYWRVPETSRPGRLRLRDKLAACRTTLPVDVPVL